MTLAVAMRGATHARVSSALLVLVVLLLVAACSGGGDSGSTAASTTSVSRGVGPSGFSATTLIVTDPDGSTREWCVWLADDAVERSRGLMEVTDPGLGGADGMAFVWPTDTTGSFFMRNTRIPLSIVFVDADGRVVSGTDMDPCPDEVENCPLYPATGPYRWALEVPAGALADLDIDADSTLRLAGDCVPSSGTGPRGSGQVSGA